MGGTHFCKPVICYLTGMLLNRIKYVKTNMGRHPAVNNKSSQAPKSNSRIEDVKVSLEADVTDMLHDIGIPAHIKGYQYLRAAIMMAVEDMDMLNCITKVLILQLQRISRPRQAGLKGR